MSLNRTIQKFNKKITDPLGGINKLGDKWGLQDITDLYREGPVGNASQWKKAAGSKGGAYASGRWIQEGFNAKERNMDEARTFDVFGSPATAGTGAQPYARAGALAYGLAAGGAALGLGAGGSSGVGYGGTTSASAAPSATAGSANPFATQVGYSGSTVGSGAPAAGSSWKDYARQQPPQQQQGAEYEQQTYDNSAYEDQMQYWTSRAMELREMADAAVRKYYT